MSKKCSFVASKTYNSLADILLNALAIVNYSKLSMFSYKGNSFKTHPFP